MRSGDQGTDAHSNTILARCINTDVAFVETLSLMVTTSSSHHLPLIPRNTISLACWKAFCKGVYVLLNLVYQAFWLQEAEHKRLNKNHAPTILCRVSACVICAMQGIEGHHVHACWREHCQIQVVRHNELVILR